MSETRIYIVSQDARGRFRLRSARRFIREALLRQLRDAATLARCEYTRVLGLDDMVDVRMPRAVWERLRAAARGEH